MLENLKTHLTATKYSREVLILEFPFVPGVSYQRMLFRNDLMIGRIIMKEYGEPGETHMLKQLLDVLGSLVERWEARNDTAEQLRSDTDIFMDLLKGREVLEEDLVHQLMLAGWRREDNKVLCAIVIPEAYSNIAFPLLNDLQRRLRDCYVFWESGCIYILDNERLRSIRELTGLLQDLLRRSVFHCGVSYSFRNVKELAVYAGQCRVALRYAADEKGGIYFCRDHALNYIRDSIGSHLDKSVIHPALGFLEDYDNKNNAELYHTLYVFLRCNCSLVQTAQTLHIHRNSLLYRIERIRELTGVDLEDPDNREYLSLSYLIAGGRRVSPPSG